MPKKNTSLALGYFKAHVEEIAHTHYGGDDLESFRHAAFQVLAPDPTLSDEQVIEMTAIDKPGDMEVDGWFVDEESETVFLFQSVGGKTKVGEAKVTKFWESPIELLNAKRMTKSKSQAARELSRELDEKLREEYAISMVFASRSGFAPAAHAFAASRTTTERTATSLSGNKKLSFQCSFRLLDLNSVAESFFYYRISLATNLPSVILDIERNWSYIVDQSGLKSLRATVPASEVVRVFKENKFKLFLLNPRGPLANAKVNKSIKKTLDDPKGRAMFHLLNNGMCATCEDFKVDGDNGSVSITDFQIVNGCQTTVTLSTRSEDELRETYVDLKLVVANEAMAKNIAVSSNSQTALRAKDYTSFDQKQLYLQTDFGGLQPPWYYEIKRGYWTFVLEDKDRKKFQIGETKGKRLIDVQGLAQASLAFLGDPSTALDRVRYVFHGIRSAEDREYYEKAFPGNVRAASLILPWRLLQYIQKEDASTRFSTFHILWIIARLLRRHYKAPKPEYFTPQLSLRLADSIDNWFADIYRLSDNSCSLAMGRASFIVGQEMQLEARDFFRGNRNYGGKFANDLIWEACEQEMKNNPKIFQSLNTSLPT